MADFLASFNFGAAEDEPIRDEACASLEEVQARFRDVYDGKVTETRAEHMKFTINIGPSTQFTIFDSQGDNIDPSLSRVSGRDALVSQPQQNPTTQYAVAQEILNAIGDVDNSSWSRTEESRKAQGWVLTYVCNHSLQQWTRHGKAAQTHAIMDYSQKELEFTSRGENCAEIPQLKTERLLTFDSATRIRLSRIRNDYLLQRQQRHHCQLFTYPTSPNSWRSIRLV